MLVAGLPGSGKSTILAGLPATEGVAVVDSQTQADRVARFLPPSVGYRRYRPLVHLLHRLAIVRAAALGPATVVVHLPATGARTRRAVASLAALTGRRAHLVWLAVAADEALRGQHERGRATPRPAFGRKSRRAVLVEESLRAGHVPPGWADAVLLHRADAAEGLRAVLADLPVGRAGSVDPGSGK